MGSLLARLNRLEKTMTPKDGDMQVISALMDELAGNAPSGAYEKAIERLSLRGHSFPQSSELGRCWWVTAAKRHSEISTWVRTPCPTPRVPDKSYL